MHENQQLARIEEHMSRNGLLLIIALRGQQRILEAIDDLAQAGQDQAKILALSAKLRESTTKLEAAVQANAPPDMK